MEKKQSDKSGKGKKVVGTLSTKNEGNYSIRGRKFDGYVIKKFDNRVSIEFERVKHIEKYERYAKSKTKMHARLPSNLKDEIKIGDYIQIRECRPLSKIIHHIVVKKIRDSEESKNIGVKEK